MKTWRLDGGALLAVERDVPTAGAEDIVVDVEAFVLGAPERDAKGDVVPGGAAVGTVSTTGDAATHLAGARVVVGPYFPCGECDVCRRGNACVCPSGATLGRSRDGCMAQRVVAKARWVCELDDELSVPGPGAALIGREATDAYALWARAGVSPGEPVVVVGRGTVAQFVSAVALARGCKPVDVSDVEDSHKPRRIFETTGTAEGRSAALAVANAGATLALYAGAADAPVDIAPLIARDVAIVGVVGAHPDLMPEVAAMAVKGELDVAAAAHVVGVDGDVAAALEAADRDGRTVVVRI